jgi:hypothetical protein
MKFIHEVHLVFVNILDSRSKSLSSDTVVKYSKGSAQAIKSRKHATGRLQADVLVRIDLETFLIVPGIVTGGAVNI